MNRTDANGNSKGRDDVPAMGSSSNGNLPSRRRVLIAGIDGYLGWSLACHLLERHHDVAGIDMGLRRRWVEEMGSWSATPVSPIAERMQAARERWGRDIPFWADDLCSYEVVERAFREFNPDVVVHLGECPSAPYSMIDARHAAFVQANNVISTLNLLFAMRDVRPDAHLVKLGTMGEYGTPPMEIPEGFFEVEFRGRRDRIPFPRQAGSWYHWSKVHGSNNIMFACRLWGLRATDVMQGVVFGLESEDPCDDERLCTRLDFDEAFGTAINRFCCQAVIGHPITLFGAGHQKRGFLPLRDSMRCLKLIIDHPPQPGEYRVLNQFAEVYDLTELALMVGAAAERIGLPATVAHVENPRRELEDHFYRPDHQGLMDLGYRPSRNVDDEVTAMLLGLQRHHDRIQARRHVFVPAVRWDGRRKRTPILDLAPAEEAAAAAVLS